MGPAEFAATGLLGGTGGGEVAFAKNTWGILFLFFDACSGSGSCAAAAAAAAAYYVIISVFCVA